jgi:hypothetical protein
MEIWRRLNKREYKSRKISEGHGARNIELLF